VLSFPLDDPSLDLRPHLAANGAAGIEPLPSIARRQADRGAVAGTNGGYWVDRPTGVPNGLHVRGRRLVAGQSASRSGHPVSRAALGLAADRTPVMDRVDVALTLQRPDGTAHRIDEINRRVRTSGRFPRALDGELVVYTPRYGAPVEVPRNGVAVLTDDLAIGSSGAVSGAVQSVHEGPTAAGLPRPVPAGRLRHAPRHAAGLDRGDELVVSDPGLAVGHRRLALAASRPRRGRRPPAAAGRPQPLRRADGRRGVRDLARHRPPPPDRRGTYRRRAHAAGHRRRAATWLVRRRDAAELVGVLRQLGAVDAVNLDGGGSTTAVINGQIVNRPSESGRHVADGLFVHATLPPVARDIAEHACPPTTPRRDSSATATARSIPRRSTASRGGE
jgi:hypothetical protein